MERYGPRSVTRIATKQAKREDCNAPSTNLTSHDGTGTPTTPYWCISGGNRHSILHIQASTNERKLVMRPLADHTVIERDVGERTQSTQSCRLQGIRENQSARVAHQNTGATMNSQPWMIMTSASERNSCVSFEMGAPPLIAYFNLPPVFSLTALKTTLSATLPRKDPLPPYFLAARPRSNIFDLTTPAALTLETIPFRIVSHTAGTPTMMVGWRARMSPRQLRTEASVRVLTVRAVKCQGVRFSANLHPRPGRKRWNRSKQELAPHSPFPKPMRAPTHMKHSSTANSMMCARGCRGG